MIMIMGMVILIVMIRPQAWYLERRAARSTKRGAGEDLEPDDGTLGPAFALRNARTGKFVTLGGMFDRYRMLVAGERPEEATVFTFHPVTSAEEPPGSNVQSAGEYALALRVLGENKAMRLRKDGYLELKGIPDTDGDVMAETMAASIEYLKPMTSYELEVEEKQVGLAVSKDLPLHIVGFNSVASDGGSHDPGPAEKTGRVHIGDIIHDVNGQNIEGIPRADALAMIGCKRPVKLGFKVLQDSSKGGAVETGCSDLYIC